MRAHIDGQAVALEEIALREHAYGVADTAYPVVAYALDFTVAHIVTIFSGYLQDYVDDARRFRDEGSETENRLAALDWPDLGRLADAHPDALCAFLLEVDYDFLSHLLRSDRISRPRYYINSVDSAVVADHDLRMTGRALDLGLQE